MNNKLIKEVKRIKELSNINESLITEDVLSDIKKFFEIAPDDMKNTDIVKKLKDFFKGLIPGLDSDSNSENIKDSEDKTELIPDTTTTDDDFYKKILDCIGAPHSKGNMSFFYAWRQSEGGKAANNPFNTTYKMDGAINYGNNTAGVKQYKSVEDGITATCKTLKLGYYTCIVDGLKNDIGARTITQKCDSDLKTWGTHASKPLISYVLNDYEGGKTPNPPSINKGSLV
jgi:hypothetical protein